MSTLTCSSLSNVRSLFTSLPSRSKKMLREPLTMHLGHALVVHKAFDGSHSEHHVDKFLDERPLSRPRKANPTWIRPRHACTTSAARCGRAADCRPLSPLWPRATSSCGCLAEAPRRRGLPGRRPPARRRVQPFNLAHALGGRLMGAPRRASQPRSCRSRFLDEASSSASPAPISSSTSAPPSFSSNTCAPCITFAMSMAVNSAPRSHRFNAYTKGPVAMPSRRQRSSACWHERTDDARWSSMNTAQLLRSRSCAWHSVQVDPVFHQHQRELRRQQVEHLRQVRARALPTFPGAWAPKPAKEPRPAPPQKGWPRSDGSSSASSMLIEGTFPREWPMSPN